MIYEIKHKKTKKKYPYVKVRNGKALVNGKLISISELEKNFEIIYITKENSFEELTSEKTNSKMF